MHSPFNTDYLYYRSARYCDAVKVPALGTPRSRQRREHLSRQELEYTLYFAILSPSCVQGLDAGRGRSQHASL